MPDECRHGPFHGGALYDGGRIVEAVDLQPLNGLADKPLGEAGGVPAGGL